MSAISIGRDAICETERAFTREWLVTNGLGGYASSTVVGANTRKYHGLLVTPTNPPLGRKLLLSKLEEEVLVGEKSIKLSVNRYPDVIYPEGYKHLELFALNPFPEFTYSFEGVRVKKTCFMPHRANAVIVGYEVSSPTRLEIRISPLVNSRGIHEVTEFESIAWKFDHLVFGKGVELKASYHEAPSLFLVSDLMEYVGSDLPEEKNWYRNMEYPEERKRGYPYLEDHYCPGFFELELKRGIKKFNILATGGFGAKGDFEPFRSVDPEGLEDLRGAAAGRLEGLIQGSPLNFLSSDARRYIVWAADSFIAEGTTLRKAVVAGYHWFSIWGRDSLLSLPGLLLVTGRVDVAKEVLLALSKCCRGGLIPNWFEDGSEEYKSVDTPLLFFYAFYKYLTYTNDVDFINDLWAVLCEILTSYISGIGGVVKVDEDWLIWSGPGLTWMDVKVGGKFVTPRAGKAVEVNALWYNALKITDILAEKTGKPRKFVKATEKMRENFEEKFWCQERNCLYDVINPIDASVRPNQIFAVSLPFQLIQGKKGKSVVDTARKKLLTPYGLRSLDKEDPNYRGLYKGSIEERDLAYHQGTVWSWLIGPFITALVRTNGTRARAEAEELLNPLMSSHLSEAGLGTISEIFDGDGPHKPRGCISQAWSVGEVLRCYVEDVIGKRPPFEDEYKVD